MDVPDDQLLHTNDGRSLELHDSVLMGHIKTSNKMLLRSFKLFAGKKKDLLTKLREAYLYCLLLI